MPSPTNTVSLNWGGSTPFRDIAGHIIAAIDGKEVLVDSGSPISFGKEPDPGRFLLDSLLHEIQQMPGGEVLTKLDMLIGRDVLGGCDMTIDWENKTFSLQPGSQQGIPCHHALVNGERVRAIFDTGAPTSYVSPRLAEGLPVVGQARDFYPVVGAFTVDLVEVTIHVGGTSVSFKAGVAPPLVQALMLGADAIVGTDVFKAISPLCIAVHPTVHPAA